MINKEHTWTETGGIRLRDDERIDDLQRNHYGIIQRKGAFCFGMDAVLLSGFAAVKKGERALDLGTGTGIIPILLSAKQRENISQDWKSRRNPLIWPAEACHTTIWRNGWIL